MEQFDETLERNFVLVAAGTVDCGWQHATRILARASMDRTENAKGYISDNDNLVWYLDGVIQAALLKSNSPITDLGYAIAVLKGSH